MRDLATVFTGVYRYTLTGTTIFRTNLDKECLCNTITWSLVGGGIDCDSKPTSGSRSQLHAECLAGTSFDRQLPTLRQSALNQVQVIVKFNSDRCLYRGNDMYMYMCESDNKHINTSMKICPLCLHFTMKRANFRMWSFTSSNNHGPP